MSVFIPWLTEHWFLGFVLIYLLIESCYKLMGRILRTINIVSHGYPNSLNMDADGDIVHPKTRCEDCDE